VKTNKKPAPRRAGTATKAHKRLRLALRNPALDEEDLELIEGLIDRLTRRSPIRRR
jgi:hypothetical protein